MLTVGKAKGCSPDFLYSLELFPQLIQYGMSLKTVISVIQIHPCSSLQITHVDMNCRSRGLNASDCSVLKGKEPRVILGLITGHKVSWKQTWNGLHGTQLES